MRLIDADKLINELCSFCRHKDCDCENYDCDTRDIVKKINNQPTVYNVNNVVKEFKKWSKNQDNLLRRCAENDYC